MSPIDLIFLLASPLFAYRGIYTLRCILDYDGEDESYANQHQSNVHELAICALTLLITFVDTVRHLLANETALTPGACLAILGLCALASYMGSKRYERDCEDDDDDDDGNASERDFEVTTVKA